MKVIYEAWETYSSGHGVRSFCLGGTGCLLTSNSTTFVPCAKCFDLILDLLILGSTVILIQRSGG